MLPWKKRFFDLQLFFLTSLQIDHKRALLPPYQSLEESDKYSPPCPSQKNRGPFFLFPRHPLYPCPFLANAQELKVKIPYIKPAKYEFRLAHAVTDKMTYHKGCLRFAELVDIYSRGEIKIKIFPSAQLGMEQVTAKMAQLGT